MPWALDKRKLNRAWARVRFAGPGDSEAYPSGAQSRFGEVEYSVSVIIKDAERPKCAQARSRPQAMAVALGKGGNAAWMHLGRSRRASREGAMRGIAPLGKGHG
jgi:hypothetical protein